MHWQVTVVAYDFPGELSLICGLMFVYGLNIFARRCLYLRAGFSGRAAASARGIPPQDRGCVHRRAGGRPNSSRHDIWVRYADDLAAFLRMVRAATGSEAQGELAMRVATSLQQSGQLNASLAKTLYPIEIQIDNEASDQYTVLRIDSPDTVGFLYEFTNALALNRIYIARVSVDYDREPRPGYAVRHRRERPQDYRSRPPARAARRHRADQTLHPPAAALAQPGIGPAAFSRVHQRIVRSAPTGRMNWPRWNAPKC